MVMFPQERHARTLKRMFDQARPVANTVVLAIGVFVMFGVSHLRALLVLWQTDQGCQPASWRPWFEPDRGGIESGKLPFLRSEREFFIGNLLV